MNVSVLDSSVFFFFTSLSQHLNFSDIRNGILYVQVGLTEDFLDLLHVLPVDCWRVT